MTLHQIETSIKDVNTQIESIEQTEKWYVLLDIKSRI